jgi:hypothetical protein
MRAVDDIRKGILELRIGDANEATTPPADYRGIPNGVLG